MAPMTPKTLQMIMAGIAARKQLEKSPTSGVSESSSSSSSSSSGNGNVPSAPETATTPKPKKATAGAVKRQPKRPRSPPLAELVRSPPKWRRPEGVPVVDTDSGPFGGARRKQFVVAAPSEKLLDVTLGEGGVVLG